MVTRASDAQERVFKGVTFELLATEERAMVTKMLYAAGNDVPFHRHRHTQAGYVVSGRYRFRTQGHPGGDFDGELRPGDSYVVPGEIEHAITVLEPGEVVDVFTPPREDYL
jgi:quercetin dioxygenase-like cupin family protein